MNKILLIASREYRVRVKKKQFIILTLLGPILFSAMMIIPMLLVMYGSGEHTILVSDKSGMFSDAFKDSKKIKFQSTTLGVSELKPLIDSSEDLGVLVIPETFSLQNPKGIEYFAQNPPSAEQESKISDIISQRLDEKRLMIRGIDKQFIDSLNSEIDIKTYKVGEKGFEDASSAASNAVAFGSTILMYMFIFLYGMQVLKGVVEEKTNRIIEVIVSSVKPFQLMLGKIIGVGLVSLTQFFLWILLSMAIVSGTTAVLSSTGMVKPSQEEMVGMSGASSAQQQEVQKKMMDSAKPGILKALDTLDMGRNIAVFMIYFILAYFFYAAIFAAIGSAVDNETDTQQLLFPITIPLLIGYFIGIMVSGDPGNSVGFWCSFIPFTSPIVMMARMPYGVPDWQLALSILILLGSFFAMTWLAARIYRVGILMYGKKATFKELLKWITYKG